MSAVPLAGIPGLTPIFVDVEASGFGYGSYPIEIGCILADGSTHCTLIRPAAGWTHWDPAAERIHGIGRGLLYRRGRTVREVAGWLNALIGRHTLYSDNWSFDNSWIWRLFAEAGVLPRFRVESLRTLLTEAQAAHWYTAKQQVLQASRIERHRASADACVLRLTYERVTALA